MTWFEPRLIAELLWLGAGVGVLAGLLGIGGGMIMVPLLTILLGQRGVAPDLAVKMAIATSMATILFTSLASLRAHHQRGAVRWDVVRAMAPGIVIGGLVTGAGVFALVKGLWLALAFAALISISATQMLIGRKPKPGRELPGPLGTATAGAAIGFIAGLVGV
ncbi:MAG: sulfite exporter TauE/SafE family protein, partial [Burkholderiales bacterium]|nr:sulfite exporter TauE/SafE family protein [Burkholderiales bacterium]